MDKGEYRRLAAELGLVIVCPDTSPRGEAIPDEPDNWQFGKGAGFYLDAKQAPFATNYRMYTYITQELPALIAAEFPVDMERQGIFGHSMGGHGALTIALKHADRFRSCSAFAPIVNPMTSFWSTPAFEKYLGPDQSAWRPYDACALIEDGARFPELFADQGSARFLSEGRAQAVGIGSGMLKSRHSAHIAHAGRLRPLLQFHFHIHGRPSALACAAAGLIISPALAPVPLR